MQFISELPAGYRTVFNLFILKINLIRRLPGYWVLMKIISLATGTRQSSFGGESEGVDEKNA